MALINLYKGNPTAGGTDGTAVSMAGNFSSPVQFTLDASQNESAIQKLAVRCNSGYKTSGVTTISDNNDTADRLKLSFSDSGGWADTLTINDSIGAANVIFYVKASSSSNELPQLDRGTSLKVTAVIEAV